MFLNITLSTGYELQPARPLTSTQYRYYVSLRCSGGLVSVLVTSHGGLGKIANDSTLARTILRYRSGD
jgi:hypothetical protein